MKTDQELLELAAKAAGYTLSSGEEYYIGVDKVDCTDMLWVKSGEPDVGDIYWSPFDDDGDALRLAVKLAISIDKAKNDYFMSGADWSDMYAFTRRAIVRAAAAIGEANEKVEVPAP